ncbi:hypothetical protein K0C01_02590 [Salinarchaeum sp. IM2453]|uniref:hypothetical protein n=1 Tax=Salinarchaeum sp. IM2453 TaxID=2862870 RepID=UPI001C828D5D|nr:hypothetical protein [Salinarchaeum sp. IM2453]QZA89068.1 hypothetical protein K0C01_02590 [Salinarchaeum sp. IM2453]
MGLYADILSDLDRYILDTLTEGRATPTLIKKIRNDQGWEYSRQYISQRPKRLAEHNRVVNIRDTGVYELNDDPQVSNT